MRLHAISAGLMLATAGAAMGAQPPAGYYSSATATSGPMLKTQLSQIVANAGTISYGALQLQLQNIDRDVENPANIRLAYTGAQVPAPWTSGGVTWNREHCWPRSLGVGDSGQDFSDAHHVLPCNPSVNSSRGNKAFGTGPGQWDPDMDFSFPIDQRMRYRGQMSRMAFYMNTRYQYLNMALIGNMTELIDWHFEQMPADWDRLRNDRVYASPQSNRNPYVDHPEFVWAVYGDFPSDAQIIVMGDVGANGASTIAMDFGAVIGSQANFESSVMFQKSGDAPTTYRVSAFADASSPDADGYQRGLARGAQLFSVPVALSSAQPGPVVGLVELETTERTSGGAGLGAGDGVDVIELSGYLLDHANGSLDDQDLVTTDSLDLGIARSGGHQVDGIFTAWNIGAPTTTADLIVTGVSITGANADLFSTDLTPGAEIIAGEHLPVTVTFDPPALLGDFEATLVISVADEDLPGGTQGAPLTILLTASTGGSSCPADISSASAFSPGMPGFGQPDGVVSPTDFTAFAQFFAAGDLRADISSASASNPSVPGFGVPDGIVSSADYAAFVLYYTAGCPCTLPGCD